MQQSGLGIVISRTHSLVVAVAVVTFSVRFHSAPGAALDGSLYKSSPTTYAQLSFADFCSVLITLIRMIFVLWISIFSLFQINFDGFKLSDLHDFSITFESHLQNSHFLRFQIKFQNSSVLLRGHQSSIKLHELSHKLSSLRQVP